MSLTARFWRGASSFVAPAIFLAAAWLFAGEGAPAYGKKELFRPAKRYTFKIDPKTPLKDLLPPAPEVAAAPAPWLIKDLAEVPEVLFAGPKVIKAAVANDPEKLSEWYGKHLGLDVEQFGGVTFRENEASSEGPKRQAYTVWSPFSADTDYFAPSEKPFMINFQVENLDELLVQLKREGVDVDPDVENYDYGKFGWIMDPEGNRIELWQPPGIE